MNKNARGVMANRLYATDMVGKIIHAVPLAIHLCGGSLVAGV